MTHFSLFRGTANPDLAIEISRILDHCLSPCQTEMFPDGEVSVRLDEAVRGFGYARADRRHRRREYTAASVDARHCQAVGLSHLVAVDLHTTQIEGFFQSSI